jgi:hypothetical protein
MISLRFQIFRAGIRSRRVNGAHQWRRDLHLFRMGHLRPGGNSVGKQEEEYEN